MWQGISYLKRTHWFLMSYEDDIITKPETEEGITRVEWLLPDEIINIMGSAWLSLTDLINSSVLRT